MKALINNGMVDGKPIIKAWESFHGWYWLATEKAWKQDSVIDSKVYKDDQIWFGLVIGLETEWGYFSQTEIELLKPMTWELKKSVIASLSIDRYTPTSSPPQGGYMESFICP